MNEDTLIKCPHCGGNMCYHIHVTETQSTKSCLTCGFTTNSFMKEGNPFLKEQKEIVPNLYVDLMEECEDGLVWMPNMINIPGKGAVFADGTSKDNWKWASIKEVEIPEEDRHKFPDKVNGGFHKYKSDPTTLQHFERDEFFQAIASIGGIGDAEC